MPRRAISPQNAPYSGVASTKTKALSAVEGGFTKEVEVAKDINLAVNGNFPKKSKCAGAGNVTTKGNFAGDGCLHCNRQHYEDSSQKLSKDGNFTEEGNYPTKGKFSREGDFSKFAVEGYFATNGTCNTVTSLPKVAVWPRIRSCPRKTNFAMEDNIADEFDFVVTIIPSKGGKVAMGRKFAMQGNFATKGVLVKKGKGTLACEFAYDGKFAKMLANPTVVGSPVDQRRIFPMDPLLEGQQVIRGIKSLGAL